MPGSIPEHVRRIVAIEGLGRSPRSQTETAGKPMVEKMREWVALQRSAAGRQPRRYASIEEALTRMQEQNKHLSAEQARHLTLQGVNQNEDGTYTWKFDNFVRVWLPYDMPQTDIEAIWRNIQCPSLLVYGRESWASDPRSDGRIAHFKQAATVSLAGAGHWVHHDKLETFMSLVQPFIKGEAVPAGLPGVS